MRPRQKSLTIGCKTALIWVLQALLALLTMSSVSIQALPIAWPGSQQLQWLILLIPRRSFCTQQLQERSMMGNSHIKNHSASSGHFTRFIR